MDRLVAAIVLVAVGFAAGLTAANWTPPAQAATTFTPGMYSADKIGLRWLPSGNTQLIISISTGGQERTQKIFTATTGGRVLDATGADIGPVPANWATTLSAFAARADAAVTALCALGSRPCDP